MKKVALFVACCNALSGAIALYLFYRRLQFVCRQTSILHNRIDFVHKRIDDLTRIMQSMPATPGAASRMDEILASRIDGHTRWIEKVQANQSNLFIQLHELKEKN